MVNGVTAGIREANDSHDTMQASHAYHMHAQLIRIHAVGHYHTLGDAPGRWGSTMVLYDSSAAWRQGAQVIFLSNDRTLAFSTLFTRYQQGVRQRCAATPRVMLGVCVEVIPRLFPPSHHAL